MPVAVTFANPYALALPEAPYRTRHDQDERSATIKTVRSCADCGAQLLSAEQAAALCQSKRRLIYRWVEQGSLHHHEAADGAVLVCSRSLLAQAERLEDATARFKAKTQE